MAKSRDTKKDAKKKKSKSLKEAGKAGQREEKGGIGP
jgi:hypothetical protein